MNFGGSVPMVTYSNKGREVGGQDDSLDGKRSLGSLQDDPVTSAEP